MKISLLIHVTLPFNQWDVHCALLKLLETTEAPKYIELTSLLLLLMMPVVSAESFLHSTRHGYCSASIERLGLSDSNRCRLDGNYSERVQYSLRKQSPSLLTVTLCYVTLRCVKVRRYDSACQCKCKQSPFFGVFWPLLSHPSTDFNETRTWSSYIKFGANTSTIFWLLWSQTDRRTHTHKLTPLNTYSLAFTWIIMS